MHLYGQWLYHGLLRLRLLFRNMFCKGSGWQSRYRELAFGSSAAPNPIRYEGTIPAPSLVALLACDAFPMAIPVGVSWSQDGAWHV
jgi:hypothetical protein